MSFRNPWKPNTRSNKQPPTAGRILFCVLLAVMIGWLVFEPFYVRYHLPLIAAELAKVEREGPDLLEQIGAPSGSTRSETMEKSVSSPNFKSKWHGVSNSLQLVATWDVPGTPEQVSQWYVQRLPRQGWLATSVPSETHSEWEREKWMLTVQHSEWWGGRDAHVRVRVRLYWHYGRTDVGRVPGE